MTEPEIYLAAIDQLRQHQRRMGIEPTGLACPTKRCKQARRYIGSAGLVCPLCNAKIVPIFKPLLNDLRRALPHLRIR